MESGKVSCPQKENPTFLTHQVQIQKIPSGNRSTNRVPYRPSDTNSFDPRSSKGTTNKSHTVPVTNFTDPRSSKGTPTIQNPRWGEDFAQRETRVGELTASDPLSLSLRCTWLAQETPGPAATGVNPVEPSTRLSRLV